MPMNSDALDRFAMRLFWFGLAIYLLVLPVRHTIAVRNIALALILVATVAHLLHRRQLPRLLLPGAWIAYAGVALASLAYAISPLDSFSEIRVEIFYAMVLFVIATTWAQRPGVLTGVGYLLALANAAFVFTALTKVNLGSSPNTSQELTSFAKAGVNSNFIVTILPLLVHRAWQDWHRSQRFLAGAIGILTVLDVIALLISFNRQSFIALGVGVLCGGALILRGHFTWRRAAGFAAALLFSASLAGWQLARRDYTVAPLDQIAHASVTKDPRWEIWRFSVDRIAEHPLTGGGFGRDVFDKLYPEFMADNPNIWHAHNMILNKGIQMGLPGMLVFLYLWYCVAARFAMRFGRSVPDQALAITGLSIVAMVFTKNMTDDFFVRDMGQLFWLVIGVLMGSLHDDRPAAKDPA